MESDFLFAKSLSSGGNHLALTDLSNLGYMLHSYLQSLISLARRSAQRHAYPPPGITSIHDGHDFRR